VNRHLRLLSYLTAPLLLVGCGQSAPVFIPNTQTPGPSAAQSIPDPAAGMAVLQAAPQVPGGCSSTFHLTIDLARLPPAGEKLWIVAVLNKDPANGFKDTLHYPKTRTESRLGRSDLDIPGNTTEGTRAGKYLLVAADKTADGELQTSYEADRDGDEARYPDGKRVTLPSGAYEIARTSDLVQKC
jgi:hypothetical protein